MSDWCAEHDLNLPVVVTASEVCRDELLFEIELDAMSNGESNSAASCASVSENEFVEKAQALPVG